MRYLYIKNGDVIDQVLRINTKGGPFEKSGPDAFISDLLLNYIKSNPVLLLSASYRKKWLKKDNIEAYVFPYGSKTANITGIVAAYFLAFTKTLFLALRFRPDRIICGRSGAMLWASFFYSILFSKPWVHSRHEAVLDTGRQGLRSWADRLNRFCMKKSRAVVCHGPYLKDQLIRIGVSPDKIIPFDISFDDPAIHGHDAFETHDFGGLHAISYIGRIEKDKGVFDLYQAFKALGPEKERACLLFVGSGKDLEELKRRSRRDHLADRIYFKAYVPHDKIFGIIKSSYIVVTPTRSLLGDLGEATEARCMTAMESIFMGVPVIAPDSGPFPYLIRHNDNGLLFRTNSRKALAEALSRVLVNDDLYRRIRAGALDSKKDIMTAPHSFSGAVNLAFGH